MGAMSPSRPRHPEYWKIKANPPAHSPPGTYTACSAATPHPPTPVAASATPPTAVNPRTRRGKSAIFRRTLRGNFAHSICAIFGLLLDLLLPRKQPIPRLLSTHSINYVVAT